MTFFRDFEKRRQTMTRLIDADNLKKAINTWDEFACLPNGKLEPFRNLEHPEMFEPYVHLRDILNAINNAPTVEYPFTHVTVKHPVFDNKEFDGWIDKQRCLLFVYPMTFEGAKALGWKWETDNEQDTN